MVKLTNSNCFRHAHKSNHSDLSVCNLCTPNSSFLSDFHHVQNILLFYLVTLITQTKIWSLYQTILLLQINCVLILQAGLQLCQLIDAPTHQQGTFWIFSSLTWRIKLKVSKYIQTLIYILIITTSWAGES